MQRRHASAVGHAATFACVRDDIRMRDRPLPRGGAFFQEWRYVNYVEPMMKILSSLLVAVSLLSGCISSSSPPPPAKTTVVVPPGSGTTVVCQDGSSPPC